MEDHHWSKSGKVHPLKAAQIPTTLNKNNENKSLFSMI